MTQIRPKPRDAILEAAFLVFAETPTASLGDVAAQAGVGRATLHRYFPGKPDLMRALARTALAELDDAAREATAQADSFEDAFRLSLEAIVPLAGRQWFLAHAGVADDPDLAPDFAKSTRALHDDIAEAQRAGLFAADLPTAWIAQAYENLVFAAWTLVRNGEATPKQAAAFAWRILISGTKGPDA